MTKSKLILHISNKPFRPLEKAANIELFFDLVFIFCMRNIIPVLTHASQLDWYTYYTFGFTFLLMLQIWFHTTLLMNRYGTGDTIDRASLISIMFLLFVMTHAISTGWEHYVIYNLSWVAILGVLVLHWFAKLRTMKGLDSTDRTIIRRAMLVLGLQALVVLVSTPLPSLPGQIGCALAVLIGFGSWGIGPIYRLKSANFEHLAERCALLVILTFGETLIGVGEIVTMEGDILAGFLMFALIVTLFLIFLNEYELALDTKRVTSGIGYMAISVWLVFLLANINAALDFVVGGDEFLINPAYYLALSVALFLVAIMAYAPYNKTRGAMRKTWIIGRLIFVALIVCAPLAMGIHANVALAVALVAIFGVFLFDRMLYFKLVPIAKSKQEQTSNPKE